MPAGGAVGTAEAGRGRAAPDALVRARAVAVLARRGMGAPEAIGRRAAPLAVLLVVTVLVLLRRAVAASEAVTRRTAMSAFRTHAIFLLTSFIIEYYIKIPIRLPRPPFLGHGDLVHPRSR